MRANNAALKILVTEYVNNVLSGEGCPDYLDVAITQLIIDDLLKNQVGVVHGDGNGQRLIIEELDLTVIIEQDGTVYGWYYGAEPPELPASYEAAVRPVLLSGLFRLYHTHLGVDLTEGRL